MAKTTKKKTARKKAVNKSQAIRDYLATHKTAGPKEVQTALAKKGITASAALVSKVKSDAATKKAKKTRVKVKVVKPATERSPLEDVKEAGDLMIKAVELVIKAGAKEAQQLVSTASEIVKKIRE